MYSLAGHSIGNKSGAAPNVLGWLATYVIWVVQDTYSVYT